MQDVSDSCCDIVAAYAHQATQLVPLSDTIAAFWRARTPLEELSAGVTAAAIPDALTRALEEPAFWSGPGRLRDHLSAVYAAVTQDALLLSGVDAAPRRSTQAR